jgi:hypothetical protein
LSQSDLPEYEVLRIKAIERFQMAELALNNSEGTDPLYEQMVENCHFGLELIMKALIAKEGSVYPRVHNLLILSNHRIAGVKFLHNKLTSDRNMLPLWLKISVLWDTNKRYEFLDADPMDYDDYYDAYYRIYKWMLNKF